MYNQTHLFLGLLLDGSQGLGISEIVDGDSQEHVQENICVAIFVKDRLKFIKSDRIDITLRETDGKKQLFSSPRHLFDKGYSCRIWRG